VSPATIEARCNAIEECYEFLLAYAAQGLTSDAGTNTGSQVREFLRNAAKALDGLADAYAAAFASESAGAGAEKPFLTVLGRDARDAIAAVELVLAQPAISSQLVDNLNANIHLRALLTDLFLIDEILKLQRQNALASS
jgi:hypothetical protein